MKRQMLIWSPQNLRQGLSLLAETIGCLPSKLSTDDKMPDEHRFDTWLNEQSSKLELDVQRVSMPLAALTEHCRTLGPSVLKLSHGQHPGYLIIAKTGRRQVEVITSTGPHKLSHKMLIELVVDDLLLSDKSSVAEVVERFERSTEGLSASVSQQLSLSLLGERELNEIWTFSKTEKERLTAQLKAQGLYRKLAGFVFGLLTSQLFFLAAWFILGSNVLSGRPGNDWLTIWLLLLGGFVVSRLFSQKKQQELSLTISTVIKRRMLKGLTDMPVDKVKSDGPSNLLTRCYESGQFESGTVSLALGAVSTLVTLVVALTTLISLQLWGLLSAFVAITLLSLLVMWRLYDMEKRWTQSRLSLTHSLAELMIGQRTRRVQESPTLRHQEQDKNLSEYITLQRQRDMLQVIYGLIPTGWNLLGIGVLLMNFAFVGATVMLPVGVGIWLLIAAAFNQLSSIYLQLIRVAVAWSTIAPLLTGTDKRKRAKELPIPQLEDTPKLLEVRDLTYRYPGRKNDVLEGCRLHLGSHDKVILEGRSGSGKSTLVSLLTGIRSPARGSILLCGVEQNMVSAKAWGRRIVMVPQYHENYLFTESLAFNLLLGSTWPAEPQQLEEARNLCRELGLGDLLARMPAELMQVVGEMGWALSHGERSRIYIARAILQKPDILILDESLASLDPLNSERVLSCVEKHCKAVLIIAHP